MRPILSGRPLLACAILMVGTLAFAEPADDVRSTIRLRGAELLGAEDTAGLPAPLRRTRRELRATGGQALVRLRVPMTPRIREMLERAGARTVANPDRDALLVDLLPGAAGRIERLEEVDWIAPYHPGLRISPAVADVTEADPRERVPLTLHLLPGADAAVVAHRLMADGLDVLGVSAGRARSPGRAARPALIVLSASPPRLVAARETISRWPETVWLDRRPAYRLHNDGSPWALQAGLANNKETPVFDRGLYGEGETIGILDTGLDADMCFFRDELLGLPPVNLGLGVGTPDLNQRKVTIVNFLYLPDNPSDPSDWDSQDHGTHVAGSAAGDDLATPGLRDGGDGMAPRAKLVIQDGGYAVDDCADLPALGCPTADLYPLFSQAYAQGARIHSDSWGDRENFTPLNIYSEGSEAADAFMWDHPDFLLLFAAGNSGPTDGTVASPASAKNVVAVGASGRAGSSRLLADFSSRGPTHDGRIKPDLTAPGQYIRSADNDRDVDSNNCYTKVSSGTSMATPTAAGAAALVREYYVKGFYPLGTATGGDGFTPSAALLKATLIASATPMEDVGEPPPAHGQGWGRILLDDALFFADDTRRLSVIDVAARFGSPLDTPDVIALEVLDSSEPLRVVLVWTDYPSTPMAALNLVNDLDLEIESPAGTTYRGNVFSGGVSQAGGAADRLNTVEAVRIESPEAGTWTVRVAPASIPEPAQGYALVATGRFPSPGVFLDRTSLVVDDSIGGNGNGILEPGEWIDLPLALRNTGESGATNVRAIVEAVTAGVEIVVPQAPLPDLATGEEGASGPVHARFRLTTSYPCTEPLELDLRYVADGYERAEALVLHTGESVFLVDDLETSTGWSYVAAESTAFRGNWELGDPDLTEFQPGLDVTVDPGYRCLFTGPNSSGDDVGDVQSGITVARSGSYDIDGHPEARVRVHRWFGNRDLGEDAEDYLRLQIRADAVSPDIVMEQLGTNDDARQWTAVDFRVADFVAPGPDVQLSVVASDGPSAGNVVEAAVDQITFWEPACATWNPAPHAVGDLIVSLAAGDVALGWSRPALDPAHGEADRYRVYRSTAPEGGFDLRADLGDTSATPSWVDTAAGPPVLFYEVVAGNASGDSEPLP